MIFRKVSFPIFDCFPWVTQRSKSASSFEKSWGAALGSSLARHDDRWRYRMPFSGTKHQVLSQGVGGRFSHTQAA